MKWEKKFPRGKGKYYITIKASPSNITLFRESRESAEHTFFQYSLVGKECEWHGCWNGKKFVDEQPPLVG